ncbi:MAG: DNA recombination protein RmuC [Chloroflexi bacterium]|nr:DNA recombination protein RmuC [Chloroflexota bacterium]
METANLVLILGVIVFVAVVVGLLASYRTRSAIIEAEQRALVDRTGLQQELTQARTRLEAFDDQKSRLERIEATLAETQRESAGFRSRAETAEASLATARTTITDLATERDTARADTLKARSDLASAQTRVRELETVIEKDTKSHQEKIDALVAAKEEFTTHFTNLANAILAEQSESLAKVSDDKIGALLKPLGEKLAEFQAKAQEAQVAEAAKIGALGEQLKQVTDLNVALTTETTNLTKALRGSSKAQGDWGELILETILKAAGLREGIEFDTQVSVRDDEGAQVRPDVVVNFPSGRKVVIDSKVSLNAWVQYAEAADDAQRDAAAKNLVASIDQHMKGLSPKAYQTLYGIESLDFVVMFVPIEGAFGLALGTRPNLYEDAWGRNILFAGPTTILFALRTIKHLWNQESQTRNAMEIAKMAANLYDKFKDFVDDLEKVGARIAQASAAHAAATNKLVSGNGNLIGRAERLKRMGVTPKKSLPDGLVRASAQDPDETFLLPSPPVEPDDDGQLPHEDDHNDDDSDDAPA